jgi:thymidylate synthase ThyX
LTRASLELVRYVVPADTMPNIFRVVDRHSLEHWTAFALTR